MYDKGLNDMKEYKITLLKGDGIGPEIVNEAVKVLDKVAEKYQFSIQHEDAYLGGSLLIKRVSPAGGDHHKM